MIQEWAAVHECLGFPHQVFAEQEFRADEVPGVEPALRPRPDGAGHQVIGIAHPMNAGSPRRLFGTDAAAPASGLRESSLAAATPRRPSWKLADCAVVPVVRFPNDAEASHPSRSLACAPS